MNKFNFLKSEELIEVKIHNKNYPVVKTGKGKTPCLLICLGTPSFRTLSKNFADIFEIYSSDVYWIDENALDDVTSVTMESIIHDIKALGDALGIEKYVMFAHSAYGIIALEFAKKYPGIASGIIIVGTPVNSNLEVAKKHESIFQEIAEEERKLIDKNRRDNLQREDLTLLSPSERWLREYVYRDAPRYWHIADFDCSELWKGVHLNHLLVRLFSDILPSTNVLNDLEKIKTPIFLASGISDYDCCPWLWKEVSNLPENFTVYDFKKSGHWPHYEEPEIFDMQIKKWLVENNIVKI